MATVIDAGTSYALVNADLVLPGETVRGRVLWIEAGKIRAVCARDDLPSGLTSIDMGGAIVAPGLVDLHMHGAAGASFNQADAQAWRTVLCCAASRGVTAVVATTATAPLDQLVACLGTARHWTPGAGEAELLGVHVEGPYFAPSQAGAQDPAHLRTPDDGSPALLLEHAGVIRIFTYAPELPGAFALTRRLVDLGIVAAAGHSAAREEDLLPHIAAGLRHMIHIWSGQSATVREGPWRKPGLLEVSLTHEALTVEMITDGKHLPPTLMKLAYRAIGPDRLCLISDATSGAGLPEGTIFRMGEMSYIVEGGVGMLLDRTAFAGSTTLLGDMLAVAVEQVGVPLHIAVRMASLNPARVIGVDNRKGSLEVGKDADLVVLDAALRPSRVMLGGVWLEQASPVVYAG